MAKKEKEKIKLETLQTVIHAPTGKVLYCVPLNILKDIKINKNEILVDCLLEEKLKYPYLNIEVKKFYNKKPENNKPENKKE